MKNIKSILHLICILSIVTVQALYADQTLDESECKPRDVSARLGSLRDQGNIGWCYANVAADLMTFRYHSQLQGEEVSAGFVAITFNQFTKLKANADAGFVLPAVWFAENSGAICPQSFQDLALKSSPNLTIRDQINGLVSLKEAFNKRKRQPGTWENALSVYQKSDSFINKIALGELTEILENSSVRSFPRHLAERLCQNYLKKLDMSGVIRPTIDFIEGWKNIFPMILRKNKFQTPLSSGRDTLIRELNEQVSKNNLVGMSYNTKIFYDLSSNTEKKVGGEHASSIVGRKWIDGQCHFKLRNSWGKRCDLYINPVLKDKCDPSTGYLWLPETLLKQTISDIMYYHR